ncbi:type IV pilin-like G/H family protein [Microcoleus sp. CAWBG58]|uniref:type IV pilin-like G/H family protein n=1 Tax=Microcoleus sp. CAWBG58 TaxID=2841651 RepID=UPI0025CFAD78|nr:type IV pilin-like G/H family protein [Microcoleus sp. CAWBG58]
MQLKEKPELNQINEQSEFLAKTYQPYRPIKEPKSVAKVDRANLQPIKERKSVTTIDIQPKEKLDLNQINQKLEVLVKNYRQDLPPIKEPKSVVTTNRQDLRSINNRKSVATIYQPYLSPIQEYISGGRNSRIIDFFVVVIIIGILAQIALPSFLDCSLKARQSEGKQYLSSMNRAQQAKYADDGAFSNSITALGIGITTQITNYNYSIDATKNAAFSYALPLKERTNLTSYVGAVFLVPVSPAAKNEKTTVAILCQADSPGNTQPPNPILQNNVPVCAAGSSEISK